MDGIEGRQTLVTGAATPVGRAVVEDLVAAGARVIAVDATDETVEQAIEELGLADADEVITRGLDEGELGSWWDLSNLIAAFYHELDAFVHIPKGPTRESLPKAVDRLKLALQNAELSEPGRVSIVVVSSDAEETLRSVANQLTEEGSGIRVSALEPGEPSATAKSVLERISIEGSPA